MLQCIDHVIVFSGLAGGDSQRLLTAAALLMLAQMAALPLLLWLLVGPELADIVEIGPFLEAFLILIVLPLAPSRWHWPGSLKTLAIGHRSGEVITSAMSAAMVSLMTATLFVVVASQFPKISDQTDQVLRVAPLYAAFMVVMALIGLAASGYCDLTPADPAH